MNLSRFSNRKIEQMILLDINSCIQSALDICGNELNDNCELAINLKSSAKINGIFADLEVLFINLLLNAKQSIIGQGKISISSLDEDRKVIITIADNGCGINAENISKIFDPFFSTRLVGSGVGLGLAVAYGVIELHGGKIHVESKPAQGSIFTITLPVANDLGD
jgi:two-component system NtrC family sensor kinase